MMGLALFRGQLAVLVGVGHVEHPGVSCEEFVAADRAILVRIGHAQHHHAAHHFAALAHAVVALALRCVLASMGSGEFIAADIAILVGVEL